MLSKFIEHKVNRLASTSFCYIDRIPQKDDSILNVKLDKTGIKKEASTCINNFINTFKKLPHVDLSNFYRNFHPFCIKGRRFIFLNGKYYGKTHDIEYDTNFVSETIYHELLHMSAHFKGNNFDALGFQRIAYENGKAVIDIAGALDEGYTELLAERYFKIDNVDVYTELVNVAMGIEAIVGMQEMESLYFKGDLYGLIASFPSYVDKKDVLELIIYIDMYAKYKLHKLKRKSVLYSKIILILSEIMLKGMSIHYADKENLKYQLHWLGQIEEKKNLFLTRKDQEKFDLLSSKLIENLEIQKASKGF